jgi:NAD(P)-dependent dehydrogenase (short-subunit alcohol dehydrogenase family)
MKTIIITGANGNLGAATVKKFLDTGYRVIAVDHSGSHLAFADANDRFELHAVNLVDESASAAFIQEMIAKHKKIDAALLLVGGFAMGDIASTGKTELDNMFSLNFGTAYYSARPLLEHMLQNNNGRLVFVGARPALQPHDGKNLLAYALSKSLLFKLADFINAAAKGKNVTASVIVPSTIDTEINRQSMPKADFAQWVQPAQIADTLEFICSDKGLPLRESVYKLYNNA